MQPTFPPWVFAEMAKRLNAVSGSKCKSSTCRRRVLARKPHDVALAELILETSSQQPDPYLPMAVEVVANRLRQKGFEKVADEVLLGQHNNSDSVQIARAAIRTAFESQE